MKRWLLILALVMAGTAIYVWFLDNFEKRPEREYVGLQGEARFNDFLEAELFLQEMQIAVESRQKLRPSVWLPPESDTLVSRLGPELAAREESTILMNWVRLGGHLVLLPALDDTRDVTLFLEDLGLRLLDYRAPDGETDGDQDDENGNDEREIDYVLNLNVVYQHIELLAEEHDAVTLSVERGIVATRHGLGDGFITLFATDSWFRNDAIDDQDHARLFLDSVAGYVDPGKVWLFYDADFTPLWRLIWDAATWLVLGLALAFVLWLWSRMQRFGPLLATASDSRRSIVEHVSAAGRFAWQSGASATLVAASVAAVIRKAERRHPGIGRLPREKQAAQIGHMVDEAPQAILRAFMVDADDKPREFSQHMKLLQKIRNRL